MRLSHIFKVFLLLLLPGFVLAQYPNNPVKSRLGYQTTGDGLTFRGSGAPAFSPGSLANAWMYLDTTNFILYQYKNFQWTKLPLVNNGLTFSGSYVQLGGTLVQNTQVESAGYTFDLGKISGTNKAYFQTFGSSPYYVGMYTTNGTSEMTMSIGNGVFNWQGDRSGEVMNFDGTPYGFSATYLGSFGAAQFKMDSARFRISGLSDYATHALATAATVSNQLYRITDGRAIYINTGTGAMVSPNILDNGTYVGILNNKPFSLGQWTTAGRPTGVNGYKGRNTTTGFDEGYFTSQWENYITSIGASANWIPTFSSAGKIQGTSTFTQVSNKLTLGVSSGKNPMVDIVTGTGDGTVNEAAGFRLRNRSNDGNTFYLQMGTSTVAKGGSNQGHSYIQGGFWGGGYNNPLLIQPKGGQTAFGSVTNIYWNLTASDRLGLVSSTFGNNGATGAAVVFNAGQGSNAPTGMYQLFDKSFWFQGQGLLFKTESGADISGGANQGIERMRISSDGLIGIGTTSPQRLFHVAGEARITDLTTDTPTRIVGADADGDLGAITLNSVWRDYQTDKAILGSDSSFVHDPSVDSTRILGTLVVGKPSILGSPTTSGYPFIFRNPSAASTYMLIESGRTSPTGGGAGVMLLASGQFGGVISFGTATSSDLTFYSYFAGKNLFNIGLSNFVTGNKNTILVGQIQDPIQWDFNGRLVIYDTITSGKALFLAKKVASSSTPLAMFSSSSNDRFTFNDDGTTRFHVYGTPATTSAALSKTESGYVAGFATDGTVTSREIKRDTTIYVTDADYNFAAAITSAQVLARHNRIIIYSKLTSGASSDSQIILHSASSDFLQCEIIIYSNDASADSDATSIDFTTNGAVDGAGGTVSSYGMSPGQRVNIRATNDGGYKWFFN